MQTKPLSEGIRDSSTMVSEAAMKIIFNHIHLDTLKNYTTDRAFTQGFWRGLTIY